MWKIWQTDGLPETDLRAANVPLAQNIRAALAVGDLTLVEHEIDWAGQLLSNDGLPGQLLNRYLAVYKQVAEEYLEEGCELLVEWLRDVQG